MSNTYSVYEAKARFSELIQKVRAGQSLIITHRGKEVAELRPIAEEVTLERRLAHLQNQGIISEAPAERVAFSPLAVRPGALTRFIEERE